MLRAGVTRQYRGLNGNIGALIIRVGFWVYFTIFILRTPPPKKKKKNKVLAILQGLDIKRWKVYDLGDMASG